MFTKLMDGYYYSVLLFKVKEASFQIGYWKQSGDVFKFDLSWTQKCDHAGIAFIFSVFGWHICLSLNDIRHWNYEQNRWFNKDEDVFEIKPSYEEILQNLIGKASNFKNQMIKMHNIGAGTELIPLHNAIEEAEQFLNKIKEV